MNHNFSSDDHGGGGGTLKRRSHSNPFNIFDNNSFKTIDKSQQTSRSKYDDTEDLSESDEFESEVAEALSPVLGDDTSTTATSLKRVRLNNAREEESDDVIMEETSNNNNKKSENSSQDMNSIRSQLLSRDSEDELLKPSASNLKIFNSSNSNFFFSSSSSSSCLASSSSSRSSSPTASSFLNLSDSLQLNLILNSDDHSNSNNFKSTSNYARFAAQLLNSEAREHRAASSAGSLQQFVFRPISKLFRYSLNSRLNLTKKETLLFLIESSHANRITAPFDQLAYSRLTKLNILDAAAAESVDDNSKLDFNRMNIKKLSKLLRLVNFNPLDKTYLRKNPLLPNCVSTLLMPFYFDIFKMTELQSVFGTKEQIALVLNLKKAYAHKTTQLLLDYNMLTSYFKENVIWNCLTLYKYQMKKRGESVASRMAYLNFYFSFVYIQIHLESVVLFFSGGGGSSESQWNTIENKLVKEQHMKKVIEMSLLLPALLEALIENGLIKHVDYIKFKRFYAKYRFLNDNKNNSNKNISNNNNNNNNRGRSIDLESRYYENCMKSVEGKCESCFPLKLKNLCRMKIRECMEPLNLSAVNKLSLPSSMKSFILFDDEIGRNFLRNRNLF